MRTTTSMAERSASPLEVLIARLDGWADIDWSSSSVQGSRLKRLREVSVDMSDALNDIAVMQRLIDMAVRRFIPVCLRAAAAASPSHADALAAAAGCFATGRLRDSVSAAHDAAASAVRDHYGDDQSAKYAMLACEAALDACSARRHDALGDLADAVYWVAKSAAVVAAADAVPRTSSGAAAAVAERTQDGVFSEFTEQVVEILMDMRSPASSGTGA